MRWTCGECETICGANEPEPAGVTAVAPAPAGVDTGTCNVQHDCCENTYEQAFRMSRMRLYYERCLAGTYEYECHHCSVATLEGLSLWTVAAKDTANAMYHQCMCAAEYWPCINGDDTADCDQCTTECALAYNAASPYGFEDNSVDRGNKCFAAAA